MRAEKLGEHYWTVPRRGATSQAHVIDFVVSAWSIGGCNLER